MRRYASSEGGSACGDGAGAGCVGATTSLTDSGCRTTPAEAIKLFALVAWHVARHPESVSDVVVPTQPAPAPAPHALPPSELAYRRIRALNADG